MNPNNTDSSLYLERLESEIRAKRNSLFNAIMNRKNHPTYGYTKAGIKLICDELFGMIYAWLYVTGTWDKSGTIIMNEDMREAILDELGIDVADILVRMRNI